MSTINSNVQIVKGDFKSNSKFKFLDDDNNTRVVMLDIYLKYKCNTITKDELLLKSKKV